MSESFVIPIAAARHNLIALGKTRSGKSSKLRVLTEYLLEGGSPVCILDPKGDWWGLKSSADGKRAGFPIVIFGGEQRILEVLIDAYPKGMTRDQITAQTQYLKSSRDTYLQKLGARKLVEKRGGEVIASERLF